jgi:hypothetical protein
MSMDQHQIPFFLIVCKYNFVYFGFHLKIMGHIKINNNIPVSWDKWIYAQDINHITQQYMRNTEHLLRIKKNYPQI